MLRDWNTNFGTKQFLILLIFIKKKNKNYSLNAVFNNFEERGS